MTTTHSNSTFFSQFSHTCWISFLFCSMFSKMADLIPLSLTSTTLLLVAFSAFVPAIEGLCSDTAVVTSLSSSGFTLFAQALHAHNPTTNSKRLTYFIPPDTAFLGHSLNVDTFHYHVSTAGALPYKTLVTLPVNSTLPTLHNTTLMVGTDGKRIFLNDVPVIAPNMYVDESCVVHGVEGPLVPIPSSVDHLPLPKTKTKPSLLSPKHHLHSRFKRFVRFIRRAHLPPFDDEKGEHDRP